jgi:hypothetical protein
MIEATTEKCFQEVVGRMNREVKPDTPENNLLFSVLPVAHNYCKAIFLLADADHKLPAMALLRVLAELTVRVMWCLYEDNPKKETGATRVMRWWKTPCEEELKGLKKILPSAGPEDAKRIEEAITRFQSEIANNPHRSAGPFYNSLKELPSQFKDDLYRLLYSPFNSAIHPNPWLFTDLVRQQGNERVFLRDPEKPSAGAIKICATTNAYRLLSIVHFHYGWDAKPMKDDYCEITSDLAPHE